MINKRVIVVRNEKRREEFIARYKREDWWVSSMGDRVAKGDEVIHIRVLEIYINGLDEFNDLYDLEADFSDVFGQLNDLKKVLEVTKQYVERPLLNAYPEEKKEE